MPRRYRNSRLISGTVRAADCRTTIRFEPEFWEALDYICKHERINRGELVRRAESSASTVVLTSAVRVYVLQWFRDRLSLSVSSAT